MPTVAVREGSSWLIADVQILSRKITAEKNYLICIGHLALSNASFNEFIRPPTDARCVCQIISSRDDPPPEVA
jgi:hypothetical protein